MRIKVSTTARISYRSFYESRNINANAIPNIQLNDIIAEEFKKNYNKAVHMFIARTSTDDNREWIEIREAPEPEFFSVFLAAIRSDSIDIIGVYSAYKKPKKARTPIRRVGE